MPKLAADANGLFPCPYGCSDRPATHALYVPPYRTAGGRSKHLRNAHGVTTSDPKSIRRRAQRPAKSRICLLVPSTPGVNAHVAVGARAAGLAPGEVEQLRRMALYFVNQTLAPRLDRPPAMIVEELAKLAARGLRPRREGEGVDPEDGFAVTVML